LSYPNIGVFGVCAIGKNRVVKLPSAIPKVGNQVSDLGNIFVCKKCAVYLNNI